MLEMIHNKRRQGRATASVALVIAGVLICLLVTGYVLKISLERTAFAARARTQLMSARTARQLQDAVEELGILVECPDGSWVAICYGDSHVWPTWSLALALDSNGWLYENDTHFCGRFIAYRGMKQKVKRYSVIETPELYGDLADIHSLASAKDLLTARRQLCALGFRRTE